MAGFANLAHERAEAGRASDDEWTTVAGPPRRRRPLRQYAIQIAVDLVVVGLALLAIALLT
jgi:hypothetical protein